MDWLVNYWQNLTWMEIIIAVAMVVIPAAVSVLIAAIVMVKMPQNYFSSTYQEEFLPNAPWITRWGAVIGKNIVGVILILAGIAMLIGPGQGILTILIGIILVDIPGKRPIEARIIKRPNVLSAVNKLREKYNKPPLIID